MRIIAILATYNERRFIGPCLEHLQEQGIDAYLIDNASTDNTIELAEPWLGRGLTGIESFPRGKGDVYAWRSLLTRKEELARELDADWFLHLDPDEIRLPPSSGRRPTTIMPHSSTPSAPTIHCFISSTIASTPGGPATQSSSPGLVGTRFASRSCGCIRSPFR